MPQRYRLLMTGREVDACMATSITMACQRLRQHRVVILHERAALCATTGQARWEVQLDANAFAPPWREGQAVYRLGGTLAANPYNPGSEKHACWADGWAYARAIERADNDAGHT